MSRLCRSVCADEQLGDFDRLTFCPMTGQVVLPGGEVSGEKQLVSSDDEGHAQTGLRGAPAHTAG